MKRASVVYPEASFQRPLKISEDRDRPQLYNPFRKIASLPFHYALLTWPVLYQEKSGIDTLLCSHKLFMYNGDHTLNPMADNQYLHEVAITAELDDMG